MLSGAGRVEGAAVSGWLSTPIYVTAKRHTWNMTTPLDRYTRTPAQKEGSFNAQGSFQQHHHCGLR